MNEILKRIIHELKHHIPFTFFEACTGIVIMLIILYGNFLSNIIQLSETIFFNLHPTHGFFKRNCNYYYLFEIFKKKIWLAITIGYTGAIGIATISDSIIPYLGELLLGLPNVEAHIGFIEKPIITNIPAFFGIALVIIRDLQDFHTTAMSLSVLGHLFFI